MDRMDELVVVGAIVALLAALCWKRPWKGPGTSHGSAAWLEEEQAARAGLLGAEGLPVGRMPGSGRIVRLADHLMTACVGPTGSGKGRSFLQVFLRDYRKGAVLVFDIDGDNYRRTADARRRMGEKVVLMDPMLHLGEKEARHRWNACDGIGVGPLLIDDARALVRAAIPRTGMEHETHFLDMAEVELTALLVSVLVETQGRARSLKTLRDVAAHTGMRAEAVRLLKARGGLLAVLGEQMSMPRDREEASVRSTVQRSLAFLASPLVEMFVEASDFSADALLSPGTTAYFVIPSVLLDSLKPLWRLVLGGLIRHVMRKGCKEALFLIDEAAALGANFEPLESMLTMGRKHGCRACTFWQSFSQMEAAFPQKPGLVRANCDTLLAFNCNAYPDAEALSKALGNRTIEIESRQDGEGKSWQLAGMGRDGGGQASCNESTTRSGHARALLAPDEILTLPRDLLLMFHKSNPPALLRKLLADKDMPFARR